MSEPESHTLVLLREIRGEIQTIDRKVDALHADVKSNMDEFAQTLGGEIADRIYRDGGIERRLVDIERRLAALEDDRQKTP